MDIFSYTPSGVCSKLIELKIDNGIIEDVSFLGGCNGNLKGISALCRGAEIEDIIQRLKGIPCGAKPTSCPDQLARSLEEYVKQKKEQKEKVL